MKINITIVCLTIITITELLTSQGNSSSTIALWILYGIYRLIVMENYDD